MLNSFSKIKIGVMILFFLVLITVGTFFVLSFSNKSIDFPEKMTSKAPDVSNDNDLSFDSDNDGLRDWEEALWKTDPKNPDSDGDNILDGAEAKNNREILFQEYTSYQTSKPVETEKISKTTETQTDPIPKPNTVENQTPENELHLYGNIAGKILKVRGIEVQQELIFFNNLGKEMSSEEFDGLEKTAIGYRDTSISLGLVSTPEAVKNIHASMIKAYANISNSIMHLTSFRKVGIVPIEEIQNYNKVALEIGNSVYPLVVFFKQNNVKFSSNEDGYIFVNPFE